MALKLTANVHQSWEKNPLCMYENLPSGLTWEVTKQAAG